MKSKLLLVFFFCASFIISQTFGVRGSLNFASATGDDVEKSGFRIAPSFGVFAQLDLNGKLSFRPEILFAMRGADELEAHEDDHGGHGGGDHGHQLVKANFIDLPLLMSYQLNENFSLLLGPTASIFLSGTTEIEDEHDHGAEDIESDATNTLQVSAAIGVEYKFNKLGIGARYYLPFSNFGKGHDGEDAPKIKLSNIEFAISYSL